MLQSIIFSERTTGLYDTASNKGLKQIFLSVAMIVMAGALRIVKRIKGDSNKVRTF